MSRVLEQAVAAVARLEAASDAELARYLRTRLEALLGHAARTCRYYREALAGSGWRPGQRLSEGHWQAVPPLDRATLQARSAELVSDAPPQEGAPPAWISTTGSTGRPVRVLRGAQQAQLWDAITIREHREHGRDARGRLAVIRVPRAGEGRPPQGSVLPDWGPPLNRLARTGPGAMLDIDAPNDVQARWLAARDPHYLLTYPSNLEGVLDALEAQRLALPSLAQVRTFGEAVGEALRARCRERLGVEVADLYSAAELGQIATQPPALDRYRCRNEAVLVEVLREDGSACAPGEPGRVVLTSLFSFAMPLIRYDIGDYALALDRGPWAGAPRHLAQVIGRVRNLLRLPDGSRRWPRMGLRRLGERVPLRQLQTVQTALDTLELRMVCNAPLDDAQRAAVAEHVRERFESISTVIVCEVDAIARGAGGKFEEFRCEL